MGLLKLNGKVEWVNKASVHKMTTEQAKAFILCMEGRREAHRKAIDSINELIDVIKDRHGLWKHNEDGYYIHTVDYSGYNEKGGE